MIEPNSLPIVGGHNLIKKYSNNDDIFSDVPYAKVIGCLMYAMVL